MVHRNLIGQSLGTKQDAMVPEVEDPKDWKLKLPFSGPVIILEAF